MSFFTWIDFPGVFSCLSAKAHLALQWCLHNKNAVYKFECEYTSSTIIKDTVLRFLLETEPSLNLPVHPRRANNLTVVYANDKKKYGFPLVNVRK